MELIKECLYTIYDAVRILKQRNCFVRKEYTHVSSHRKLCILGNGESLNDEQLTCKSNIDYMVVNRHVLADNYTELKPRYYVLADPYFFEKERGKDILKKINEITDWDMTVFLPYNKITNKSHSTLFTKSNIQCVLFNATDFRGFKQLRYWLYDCQLAMPFVGNVIVSTIMLALQMDYQCVELYGVEHSWTKYLYVREDNLVYLENTHFYDKEEVKPRPQKDIQELDEYPMYLSLKNYSKMFESYWEIKQYLIYRRKYKRIINCTKKSFIDAFIRKG